MHEIITLQLGAEANYLGSHFWNAQESYFTYSSDEDSPVNHDIHFRPGIGADGSDTYTPRTLIYDFKPNFGTLRRVNELYDVTGEHANATVWSPRTSLLQHSPPIDPSPYQTSLSTGTLPPTLTTNTVRYWSDYTHTYFHPRSLIQIPPSDLPPTDRAFTSWSTGTDLFAALSREEDLLERDLRPFAEEADQLQGVQVWMSSEDAWAGFGSAYLESLRDEFGKTAVWIFGLGDGSADESAGSASVAARGNKVLNQAKTVREMCSQASVYVPLSVLGRRRWPEYLSLQQGHPWHRGAVFATAVESVLLPTRLKAPSEGTAATLDQLAVALSGGEERRIARLAFEVGGTKRAFELTNGHAGGEVGGAMKRDWNKGLDLLPSVVGRTRAEGDHDDTQDTTFSELSLRRGTEIEDDAVMDVDREDEADGRRRLRFRTPLAMPLPDSFPTVYSLQDGNAKRCSVTTSARTATTVRDWVRQLEGASRARASLDEREDLRDGLLGIAERYTAGFEDELEDDGDEDWD